MEGHKALPVRQIDKPRLKARAEVVCAAEEHEEAQKDEALDHLAVRDALAASGHTTLARRDLHALVQRVRYEFVVFRVVEVRSNQHAGKVEPALRHCVVLPHETLNELTHNQGMR